MTFADKAIAPMDMTCVPIQRTIDWLCSAIKGMPPDIRMVYIDSGEHATPSPDHQTVATYDLFGFRVIPFGGFDPRNNEHVRDLGNWDFEAHPNCDFPDLPFDKYNWLDILESAVSAPSVVENLNRRNVLLLFADHDGPITVLQ